MIIKKCKSCLKDKPGSEYYSHQTTADRLRPVCKQCFLEDQHRQYRENPKKVLATNKRWIDKNYTHFRAQQNEYKLRVRPTKAQAG
jgi:hypothetical protein